MARDFVAQVKDLEDFWGGGGGGWLGAMKKELSSRALLLEGVSGVSGMAGFDDDDEGTGVLSQSGAGLLPEAGVSGTWNAATFESSGEE